MEKSNQFRKNLGKHNRMYGSLICDAPIKSENRCVLCKGKISGYGNNAFPLASGKCCDDCNLKVIAKRMSDILKN